MEKLKMHSPDLTQENIARIRDLFPGCVTEARDDVTGKLRLAVDFDQLRQELSDGIVEGPQERYRLDWPGKREALLASNAPINKSLRPCLQDSMNFYNTGNIFVEGDNLDALKMLQEAFLGRVKVIYVDPPYNTGNDFIYRDNFSERKGEFFLQSGQIDGDGQGLVANKESSGRFHSSWLTMMYPRLRLARNFLAPDGVIFLSIDDNEHANLKRMCDEIFGEKNFIGEICRATGQTTGQDSGGLGSSFDYILAYSRDAEFDLSGIPLTTKDLSRFDNEDEKGRYAYDQMRKTGSGDRREDRPKLFYPVTSPDGEEVLPIAPAGYESRWRFERKAYDKLLADGYILWKKTRRGDSEVWWPYVKYYLEGRTKRPSPLWADMDGNKKAARDVRALFDGIKVFDFPKPLQMIMRCIQIAPNSSEDDIVMDFFAGSGSTAHAVMELNAQEGTRRRCISIQWPEEVEVGTEAHKAGYRTISEIAKERIRRAAAKVKEDYPLIAAKLDLGFRVLKIDTSNMKNVYYRPDELKQGDLLDMVDNVKEDRTPEDLLFQVLVDWGVDLTLPIRRETVQGKTVFFVDDNALVACFDKGLTEELVKELAKREPLRVVFRDNGFVSDAVKINVEQIFRQLSPTTDVKSI